MKTYRAFVTENAQVVVQRRVFHIHPSQREGALDFVSDFEGVKSTMKRGAGTYELTLIGGAPDLRAAVKGLKQARFIK